jgi:AraC family transcriptional regulator
MKNDRDSVAPVFRLHGDPGATRAVDSSKLGSIIHPGQLRNALASLHTETTSVEVSDLDRASPTILTFTPHRIVISSLVTSTATIQYGYVQEDLVRTASVGAILFMLPGREIKAHITPGRLCTVTCSFDNDYAAERIGPLDTITHAQLHSALDFRSALISAILLRLMHEALHPGPISTAVVDSLGHSMLIECAHWLRSQECDKSGKFTIREFQRVEHYLAGLTGKAPTVTDLAALCGFSERYFAKLFREFSGMAVSHYIKAVQLSKAKALLLETDFPLKEIAYRLGYSTIANFTSWFRAATGVTPGQFRSSH